jgi:hypothetical protein
MGHIFHILNRPSADRPGTHCRWVAMGEPLYLGNDTIITLYAHKRLTWCGWRHETVALIQRHGSSPAAMEIPLEAGARLAVALWCDTDVIPLVLETRGSGEPCRAWLQFVTHSQEARHHA